MKITGIIVEYNPFHNGHQYHIEQARAITKADVVVAVMSGNYVQRGEPAMFDKWTRAKEALLNGVDVVFELPFAMAVQPGHIFAEQAISLLHAVGVDTIVCGAEHPDYQFMQLAQLPIDNHRAFTQYQQTYATTFYQELADQSGIEIQLPNDILSLSYAKAIVKNGWTDTINLQPIKRINAAYHQTALPSGSIASASAIRKHNVSAVLQYVPEQTAVDLLNSTRTSDFATVWWPFIQYRLQTAKIEELRVIYQVSEGLEYKLKAAVEQASSYAEFMQLLKSKRYTNARLQRMVLYVLLNVTTKQMQQTLAQPYLNLLGATPVGQKWLRQVKKQVTIPLFSKIGAQAKQGIFALQYQVDQVFTTIGNQSVQNIGRIPWRINDSTTLQ
ncbi:nucleotidyltransferase [Periweissella ghanensis]|uniref:tRNA(Met) cytidine acetate ligase n=1 Tax=Periweissella ghanensis TaxID=467997 RepID=A0ABM8ZD28_9LACO|nr:nucleotidyltransferase [Periweissella ghanensis]MCM0601453.1 nucleotidyltransferase [Periweissella ghanensis]CAH0419505.1 tRNA(Met) cytidine acetate ligase [Periweissella ghanensis]